MRYILYPILFALIGFFVGTLGLDYLFPEIMSRNILLGSMIFFPTVFAIFGIFLASKLNNFDNSPLQSLRINFFILGLSGIIAVFLMIFGLNKMLISPTAVLFDSIFIGAIAAVYLYYGITLKNTISANGLHFLKIFLVVDFIFTLIFTFIFNQNNWPAIVFQGYISFSFYRTLQQQVTIVQPTVHNNP